MTFTISDTTPRSQFTAGAAQTVFTIPFEWRDDSDLVVRVDGALKVLNSNYTLIGAGISGGGSCTFASPLVGGEIVTISRDMPIARTSDQYTTGGQLPAVIIEASFDDVTLKMQQLERDLSRSMHMRDYDTGAVGDFLLPLPADRKGKYGFYFNAATGQPELFISIGAQALSQSIIAAFLTPRTAAEITAGVTPTALQYWEGNPRRYGAVGDGAADDTTPVLNALAVMKATYINSGTTASVWALNPGDRYLVTSPVHFGSTTASGLRIKYFQGNGAKFICSHTGIGVDLTNFESGVIWDLRVTNGASIPKILVLECRFANSTSQGMRNKIYNLIVEGRASICGLFNYGSETNTHYSPRILMDTDTPFGHIISDTGRYWDGAAFVDVKPSIPNMDGADPVLPGVSTTNNNFIDYWNSHATVFASGGRAALQFVGSGKHVFNGTTFMDTGDTAVRPVMSVSDTGVGGTDTHGIRMPNWNPHTPNLICWEHVSGGISGLYLDNVQLNVPTTADFQLTAGTITDCVIHGHKVILQGNANGNNQFRVDTSLSATGTIEGHVYLGDAATVSLTGNNAQKRCVIHDGDNCRTYRGWDVSDSTTVSTVGVGEDNLKTYTVQGSAAFMGAADRYMRVRAAGTKTGGAGTKQIKFFLGATSWTVFPAANDTLNWKLEVDIHTTGSAAQILLIKFSQNNVVVFDQMVTAAIDLTASQTMKLTGECSNGADLITQTLWKVERR